MKKIVSVLLATLFVCSLFGCSANAGSERFSGTVYDAFDTVTTVTVYDSDKESFEKHLSAFEERLKHYDMLYSIYDDVDDLVNLREINEKAGSAPVEADGEIISLLSFGKECYKLTDGAVNICMGSVLSLWHEAREVSINTPEKAYTPEAAKLKDAALHTDINNLIIDEEKSTVFFKDGAMKLDVGAIAKGYAADRLAQYIKDNSIWESYAISIGGNVITSGYKNGDGSSKWNIEIENPDASSGKALEVLSVSGQAVVTSGDYQRFFTVNGKNYCHIIDPKTLMPAESFSGVSIVTDRGSALADALSTALFILPFDEGKRLVDSLERTEAVWVSKSFEKTYSQGFEDYIKQ